MSLSVYYSMLWLQHIFVPYSKSAAQIYKTWKFTNNRCILQSKKRESILLDFSSELIIISGILVIFTPRWPCSQESWKICWKSADHSEKRFWKSVQEGRSPEWPIWQWVCALPSWIASSNATHLEISTWPTRLQLTVRVLVVTRRESTKYQDTKTCKFGWLKNDLLPISLQAN